MKGFFFDQVAGKLTQLARSDSNEVMPVELQAMAESIANLEDAGPDDTRR